MGFISGDGALSMEESLSRVGRIKAACVWAREVMVEEEGEGHPL